MKGINYNLFLIYFSLSINVKDTVWFAAFLEIIQRKWFHKSWI